MAGAAWCLGSSQDWSLSVIILTIWTCQSVGHKANQRRRWASVCVLGIPWQKRICGLCSVSGRPPLGRSYESDESTPFYGVWGQVPISWTPPGSPRKPMLNGLYRQCYPVSSHWSTKTGAIVKDIDKEEIDQTESRRGAQNYFWYHANRRDAVLGDKAPSITTTHCLPALIIHDLID